MCRTYPSRTHLAVSQNRVRARLFKSRFQDRKDIDCISLSVEKFENIPILVSVADNVFDYNANITAL